MELPTAWRELLADELPRLPWAELAAFVAEERLRQTVFPADEDLFRAYQLCSPEQVRVVLLGQDPYHDDGQAHGLCFSVRPGVPLPPSLKNILKELQADLGMSPPDHGCLEPWARQGVLLTNVVLTVRAHQPHSHRSRGWEEFTDAVIARLSADSRPRVFVLWGNPAQQKARLIDVTRHRIVAAAHPSPLSARRGFFGSRPFSTINRHLRELEQPEIDWRL